MKINSIIYTAILILTTVLIACAQEQKKSQSTSKSPNSETAYTITNSWDLPTKLNEISGISYIGNEQLACVQDEDGIIFVYDLAKKEIVQEIAFADAGDYEGIAVVKDDAYVMRSDGMLYLVKNYRGKDKETTSVQTSFTAKNNMESLFYDEGADALLTTPKDKDIDDNAKNFYAMPLSSLAPQPTVKVKLATNEVSAKSKKSKKSKQGFSPSEIAINPQNKDLYILEGKTSGLSITDSQGIVKKHYILAKGDFAQPEGITFSADGRMFISNEAGKSSKANIREVKIVK